MPFKKHPKEDKVEYSLRITETDIDRWRHLTHDTRSPHRESGVVPPALIQGYVVSALRELGDMLRPDRAAYIQGHPDTAIASHAAAGSRIHISCVAGERGEERVAVETEVSCGDDVILSQSSTLRFE